MIAKIINLRQARKTKTGDERTRRAAANRASFGASKAARTNRLAERDRVAKVLDAHRRDLDRPQR